MIFISSGTAVSQASEDRQYKTMKTNSLLCILLVAATLLVYWQAGENTFIYFDDIVYVGNNPHVVSGLSSENVIWAFTNTYAANWHPLTWISHMLDIQLYGLAPRGHHLTNVFIHALSSLLLFLLLVQITGARWQSFVVAVLFSLHPLHVESVAWVAERKDVLCGFFWIITLLLYAKYVKSSDRKIYVLTLCSFAVGLMAKSMLVTLPLVLLLLDYWPLCRFRQQSLRSLVKEKTPFLSLSLLSSIMTIYAQHAGTSLVSLTEISFVLRLENAVFAYARYVINMFLPYNLAIFYPFRAPSFGQFFISSVLLVVSSLQVYRLRKRFPYLLIGWLWFLITLLPVIGLVQVGDQSMADRYTYMPYIGLFIMFSWGIFDLFGKCAYRKIVLSVITAVVIVICSLLTNHQLAYWRNDTILFTHALNVTHDNYKIHDALGVVLAKQGKYDEAFRHFSAAIQIIPNAVIPYYDMGVALESSGRAGEAAQYYQKVISMDSGHVGAHTQMGSILCRSGQFEDALTHFKTALRLDPDYYPAQHDLNKCIDLRDK